MNNFVEKVLHEVEWIKTWEAKVALFWVDLWMSNHQLEEYKNIFGCNDIHFYAVFSRNGLGLESFLDKNDVDSFKTPTRTPWGLAPGMNCGNIIT